MSQKSLVEMENIIYNQLASKLKHYNMDNQQYVDYIDPYQNRHYLSRKNKISDYTPILRHLLHYTYNATIDEVVNQKELFEINANLKKLEKMIKKLLKEEESQQPQQSQELQPQELQQPQIQTESPTSK